MLSVSSNQANSTFSIGVECEEGRGRALLFSCQSVCLNVCPQILTFWSVQGKIVHIHYAHSLGQNLWYCFNVDNIVTLTLWPRMSVPGYCLLSTLRHWLWPCDLECLHRGLLYLSTLWHWSRHCDPECPCWGLIFLLILYFFLQGNREKNAENG